MNCKQARESFDDYLDNALQLPDRIALEEHLASCPRCSEAITAETAMRDLFGEMPVEPPTPGFARRALREAARRNSKPAARSGFAAGFLSALAAALVVWLVVGQPPAPEAQPDITLAVHESRTVRLVFNAPRDVPEATLALELPPNLALSGYGGQRELTWQTALRQGQNSLALPLQALGAGESELVARVRYGDREKRFQVRVSISGNPV